jgi:hypothetical protein
MRRLAAFPTTEAMLWLVSPGSAPALAADTHAAHPATAPTSDTGEPSEVVVSSATLKASAYPVRPTGSCLQRGARGVAGRSRLGRIGRRGPHRAEMLAAGAAHLSDRRRAILVG